jgi:acetyl-CoA carboxylase biotin carboxylase subunit
MPVRLADRAICIGPSKSGDSYLRHEALISGALATGCQAIHPGYGFVAESAEFAELCSAHGLVFIGPPPDVLRLVGNKSEARRVAHAAGLQVLPGSGPIDSVDQADIAGIGYPMLIKAVAGGGGRGIRTVSNERDLRGAFEVSRREAKAAFGDDRLYVEKFVPDARHLEVQILADRHGNVVHLGERECSVQRRYQKILEEAPATISDRTRQQICESAIHLAKSLRYVSAGTVEFIYDTTTDQAWFIEVNARIQVEHPVTEMVTEVDIVGEQLRIAEGEPVSFEQDDVAVSGHAIEWRVTAESVSDGLVPQPGLIERWRVPVGPGIRVDTHCFEGYTVPPFYDSLLAKLIAHGPTREQAIQRLHRSARSFEVRGVPTTLDLCQEVLSRAEFTAGVVSTRWLDGVVDDMRKEKGR